MLKLPSPVLLSTFFRLSFLAHDLCKEELLDEKDLKVNSNIFYLKNYNHFGVERVGGAYPFLKRKYKETIKNVGTSSYNQSNDNDDNSSSEYFNIYG